MKKTIIFYLMFMFVQSMLFGQSADRQREMFLENDIRILSHDSMMGREAGSKWEIKTHKYLVSRFAEIGLKPYFEDGSYLQKFSFKDGADYSQGTSLVVDGISYELDKDFFPLSKSANAIVNAKAVNVGFGLVSSNGRINDYKKLIGIEGKIFVMELSVPGGADKYDKHSEYANLDSKIENAVKRGAKAIIFINSDKEFNDPRNKISNRIERSDVPVVFIKEYSAKDIKKFENAEISLSVNIKKITKNASNIIGYIDNGSDKSIVLGAHFDHLGMGGESSRSRGINAVHNGADDNASGTAAVIELARRFVKNPIQNYNIIFMAFSAEEKGLLGSSYFVKSDYFKKENIVAMLNFDMVGRLDTIKRKLTLIGTGTALEWDSVINITDNVGLDIKRSRSGISGSDQMSFYLNQIPVLFFFTGLHTDYHTINDDVEKINFSGAADVVQYAVNIVNTIDGFGKLTYNKTKDVSRHGRNNKGKMSGVTLGIVPDFTSEDNGLGIQAVLDDRPASKAGLKAGDIIIKLGSHEVNDIQDYMKALKTFKKGNETKVVVLREGKPKTFKIKF